MSWIAEYDTQGREYPTCVYVTKTTGTMTHVTTYVPIEDWRVVQAESAKLRELATGLYRCWLGEGCDGCPMQDSDGWCIRDLQLRELGIEVTE